MYAIYAYIDPQNHPNVGIYGSPMECLGHILITVQTPHPQSSTLRMRQVSCTVWVAQGLRTATAARNVTSQSQSCFWYNTPDRHPDTRSLVFALGGLSNSTGFHLEMDRDPPDQSMSRVQHQAPPLVHQSPQPCPTDHRGHAFESTPPRTPST